MKFNTIFILSLTVILLCFNSYVKGQGVNESNFASLSGNAMNANKMINTNIDLYTGIPSISLPLYKYSSNNGLELNITIDYCAGGIRTRETPSCLGLGWNLNSGGIITRTVRGMPDEYPGNGYLFNGALPADYRPNGSKYYSDSLDTQQDVFQFNFNGHSGRFFIGKNNQIVTVPLSKIKISYETYGGFTLGAFTIVAEDGVKYVFRDQERSASDVLGTVWAFGYEDYVYPTAWNLSKIIAPFATDSIQFSYTSISTSNSITYPLTLYANNGVAVDSSKGYGNSFIYNQRKVSYINLPDNRSISFVYDTTLKYDNTDYVLDQIKFSDSVLRYGYVFERRYVYYDTVVTNYQSRSGTQSNKTDTRAFLSGVRYFTSNASTSGYQFAYYGPIFGAVTVGSDTIGNRRDHWGFYKSSIPNDPYGPTTPNITGIYNHGVSRTPAGITDVIASTLSSITQPNGGITEYTYEPNSTYPYDFSPQSISINGINSTQTTILLNQVVSNNYNFSLGFNSSISRVGNPTFSGTGNLTCTITSLDGLTTYATKTISLFQVFYTGSIIFSASIPNGSYLFKTTISGGTSAPSGLPLIINWDNEIVVAGTAKTVGGIRIKYIRERNPNTHVYENVTTYNYVTVDGKSSGFLGTTPVYHYPVASTVYTNFANPVTTNLIAICSEPISNVNFTQGGVVGYSRVEVIKSKNMAYANNGKEVYEFTDLKDAQSSVTTVKFPFAPLTLRDWAIGLPKRKLVYDSSGKLVMSTTNIYATTNTLYENSNFQSLKLGITTLLYNYNTSTFVQVPIGKYFTGQQYFLESGRTDLVTSIDSMFYSDNSIQVSRKDIQIDTNYNVIKITSPYDPGRGLFLEKRFYYPYQYSNSVGGITKKLKDSSIYTLISSESWIVGDANPRILSGQIIEFQQLPKGYIKPLNIYDIVSNSPVPQSTIGVFNPSTLIRNSTYFKIQQSFPVYDSVGNTLEAKDASSGISNSIVMNYSDQYPVANVSNSKFSDIAYTSFESDGNGNWVVPSALRTKSNSITGKKCYDLVNGSISKNGLTPAITYLITYWTTNSSPITIAGSSGAILLGLQNGWRLYSHTITGVSTVTVSGSGLIDELRLHPKDANMTTTTFEPNIGETGSCDANNTIVYREYDPLNRIIIIRDKDMNIFKKYEYSNIKSIAPNWMSTGLQQCHQPKNGNMDRQEADSNAYSLSYGAKRYVTDHVDCVQCAPVCTLPSQKLLNCTCEPGCKTFVSSLYRKFCDGLGACVWRWECTYYYRWSDNSVSANFTEVYDTACPPGDACSNPE